MSLRMLQVAGSEFWVLTSHMVQMVESQVEARG